MLPSKKTKPRRRRELGWMNRLPSVGPGYPGGLITPLNDDWMMPKLVCPERVHLRLS